MSKLSVLEKKKVKKKSLGITALHWNFAPKKENTLNPMISSIEAETMETQFLAFPTKIGSSFDDWQLTIKCN